MTAGDRPIHRDDVWALLAVAYVGTDGRGADEPSIRGLSPAIRRAPLSDSRALRGALDRLRDAGLVDESGGRARASAAVAAFLAARTHRRGLWHDFRDLARHLGVEDLAG